MNQLKYIFMILLGGIMYGMMSSVVKISFAWNYNAAEIAFAQALLAALFLGLIYLFSNKKKTIRIEPREKLFLLFTGGAVGMVNFFYYSSVNYISASLAVLILMQFTWLSLILDWIINRKRPSVMELFTALFVLSGTWMAADNGDLNLADLSIKGVILAVLSSVAYAVYVVANGKYGKTVHWQLKSFLIMAGSATLIFLINGKTILFESHPDIRFLFLAFFLSIVGTMIPTALFAVSIPKIGAGISSILMTIELPTAILCAHYLLHESVSIKQFIGILIMLLAISAMNYYKIRKKRKQKLLANQIKRVND